MNGILYEYFVHDHRRLESLLNRATQQAAEIDLSTYSEFRAGLLRHIGIEEKILMPMIKRLQGGTPYPSADVLRLEHGALAALLAPVPNRQIVAALHSILDCHNRREECENCLYAVCQNLFGDQIDRIMDEIASYPAVPTAPYADLSRVREATKRALQRAGFDFDRFEAG
jgi:iron-sulfur cluster repair protein YtfE (RIC family)